MAARWAAWTCSCSPAASASTRRGARASRGGLAFLGVELDETRNDDGDADGEISAPERTSARWCSRRVRTSRSRGRSGRCSRADRWGAGESRRTSRSTPTVQTPRLTSAAATIAVATSAESTCSASPSEAIAAGTPSCALAARPVAARPAHEQRRRAGGSATFSAASAPASASSDGMLDQAAQVELRAEHDEVERDEEAVGDAAHLRGEALRARRSARPSRRRRSRRSGCSCRPSARSTRAGTGRAATGAGQAPSGAAWRDGAHCAPTHVARAAARQAEQQPAPRPPRARLRARRGRDARAAARSARRGS